MATSLSVCIITKNEAPRIARCLDSVHWADELIVVDSGSTDETVSIARSKGAKVIETDWPGWAIQKNRSIDAASHDWVLSLDADEWLPPNAEEIIRTATEAGPPAYTLRRKTFFLGKWIAHQGWYPDRQIRLFKKSVTRFSEVPVHEKVEIVDGTADLNLDIMHESYTSLAQYKEKNAMYSKRQAEQQQDQKLVALKLFLKPPARFIQTYFLQLGFLDGWKGLLLSLLRSKYEWQVLTQILRLRRPSAR